MPPPGGEEVIIDTNGFKSGGSARVPARFRNRTPGERPRAHSPDGVGRRPRPVGVSSSRARADSPGARTRNSSRQSASPASQDRRADSDVLKTPGFRMGEAIEAQFKGGTQWYKGKVLSANLDGTYDIRYDDGDEESAVAASLVRKSDVPARKAALAAGTKVEARYRGKSRYYPGRIARDRGDGTYDVDYDDGEKEMGVDQHLIRSLDTAALSSPRTARSPRPSNSPRVNDDAGSFRKGDKIEARYRGRERHYPGTISRDRGDGTYDIDYDDGERETRVRAELIRLQSSRGTSGAFREGDKIEAKYRGRDRYYAGTISRDRGDGTYDIQYDDGEGETRVKEQLIRRRGGGGKDGFSEGDKIEARYRGRQRYYPGKISRKRGDGTYDIDYDDGEREARVEQQLIRLLDGSDHVSSSKSRFREGEKVEARYRGKSKYYAGIIARDRGDSTYDIDYDDGEKEMRVAGELIRSAENNSGDSRGTFREGDKIEAKYRGRDRYYAGRISRSRGDGTYDIDYDDGEKEIKVRAELIRMRDADDGKSGFKEGDKVEARYRGRDRYYPGKISRNRGNGTYDIDYDDGEIEARVDEKLIRLRDARGGSSESKAGFRVGEKIEARYRNRSKYYAGRIAHDRGDGTYDIDYDDGEKETRVGKELIRSLESNAGDPGSKGLKSLREGDKIEAKYRGRERYYPGKISRDRGDGTYDIDYDDGEKETRVRDELIRLREDSGSKSRFNEGDTIEARYRGRERYLPGKIRRDRVDGTYDIDYDNGECELRVEEKLIRLRDSGITSGSRSGFILGEKIEARYRGRSKYYSGCIARDRKDGTYDVDYDDGEKETRVAVELIRSLEPKASGSRDRFREGDKVEARYRGRERFYPGKISRDRGDGTFDIEYDDGEREVRIRADLIRLRDGNGDKSLSGFKEGDKIEARYRGRERYYAGKISRDRGDGTYDIDYDDGERETRVEEKLIRLRENGVSSSSRFRKGEKVEARYRNRSKYYAGRISRDRGDGTYDIDYDDGEKETRVAEDLIRSLESNSRGSASLNFREGDIVEAKYRGRERYYPGKISRDRGDGTYDVDYDDGEKETRVRAELIRSRNGVTEKLQFKEGDSIEARYRGRERYYPGKISRDRNDGTYDINYDDGEKEIRVRAELIRLREDYAGKSAFREGDKVEAKYRGRDRYYPGKVSRVRGDGSYDIDYDDGERETRVEEKLIRLRDVTGGVRSVTSAFRDGEKVEARYRGKSKYYSGRIARDRCDGTFDIDYDDGEKETRVAEELIRSLEPKSDISRDRFRKGDKIEAKYRGRERYYPGEISRDRGDGTYDIDYDDGERETNVRPELIRLRDSVGDAKHSEFKEGDNVEARYRGRTQFYPGRISRDRRDGTYDIDYDDGERETRVEGKLIRLRDGRIASRTRFNEGEKVEARYRGRSKYYEGRIARARGDGTYDIDYDDGEKEARVAEDLIRPLESKAAGASSKIFAEGENIEAKYRGRERYYPGRISRDRGDGTYDIDYNDGEKETRVPAELIRSRNDSDGKSGFKEGDRIVARYRGRERYYPGKITRDRGDGTYDIDYDDGERETRVEKGLIRLRDATESGSSSKSAFFEGEKVEARYRGRSKYYTGRIARDRGDRTYDIDYDDGEKEMRVAEELIRPLEPKSSPRREFREGDKIEAKYRGRERYYPGKIRRDREDGTFDVDYDDGEREIRVRAELIRFRDTVSGLKSEYREGDKIEARYRGRDRYYPGKITRDRGDGTYDIDYDDGEHETRVEDKFIRPRGGGERGSSSIARFHVGDKIEARYRGRNKYYTGRIVRDRGDRTFDIQYDDGEKESGVAEELIRLLETMPGGRDFCEGDNVEARYRGRERYYPGKISRDRGDGTYDIAYDDGEREARVEAKLIRRKDKGGSPAKRLFCTGDKVEARYRGRNKFYSGCIARDRGDGTYDIDYDDGEKEMRVTADLIRPLMANSAKADFLEGDRIEAKYRGRDRYYPGRISRARGDGTYDIEYSDGERESCVRAELIRRVDASSSSSSEKFRVGDAIEARYRGRSRFYGGTIARANMDGSYDIDYDDGEKETRIDGSLIRLPGDNKATPRRSSFQEGDRVEAQFRGKGQYYPGRIRTDRGDGTFDVTYDDGATETRIREDLIRHLADDAPTAHQKERFSSGDHVEARYRGREQWLRGVVASANIDGTYDVDYDNGDRETRVADRFLRPASDPGIRSPRRRVETNDENDLDSPRRLRQRLRELEDRLEKERSSRLSRLDGRQPPPDEAAFDRADIQHLLRENRELRREVALGESRLAHTWGGAGYASPTRSRMAPWHPMLTPDDDVIEELVGNVNSAHGSVGQWLNTCATPLEKRNFIEFVQTLEDFEGRRGLAPQQRSSDPNGTIKLALGPSIKAELKFIV